MNSFLAILSMVAMVSAVPYKLIPIQIEVGRTQSSEYSLKTDHPVQVPAPIIKGVPRPYLVPVQQPYAVPRAVPVEVPRPYTVTVERTVPVPVIARGEPIIRTRVIQSEQPSYESYGSEGLSGLSLGGGYGGEYGGESLSLGGYSKY